MILSRENLAFPEEELNLNGCGFWGIGTVNDVALHSVTDILRKISSDGPRKRLTGISGSHHFTILQNSVFAFQYESQ